ncbi:phosphate-starvation-inducible E [Meridianimarinicoccus roseus]|uniref:Protein PsiE n=2 Tax=Meridianimarinicoccus roseus TaxID=2072018 RepID=A0A2V2LG91_9RHOB|nr:phosphate-starvation-inducible E [Meridianimarinicoccus roseus]
MPSGDGDSGAGAPQRRQPRSTEEAMVERGLKYLERLLLLVVVGMTLAATFVEVMAVWRARSVDLGDILLMFLYTEVIAMVSVFYTGRGLPIVFPIFIAITALSRLIVLQGKEMDPANILIEAGAILLLAVSAVVLLRFVRRLS